MAGVKGKSGGARPGAGMKPKAPAPFDGDDPMEFLIGVMQGKINPSPSQLRAATAAARIKNSATGAKRKQQEKANQTATNGRLAPSGPPRLVANNGG